MSERIYLAGRWRDRYRFRSIRTKLQDLGHTVTSRWIDDDGRPDDYQWASSDYPAAVARRDKDDVRRSTLLILDLTQGSSTRGGMYWEAGIADERLGKRRVWIVGAPINVFTYELEHPHFRDWNEVFAEIERELQDVPQ